MTSWISSPRSSSISIFPNMEPPSLLNFLLTDRVYNRFESLRSQFLAIDYISLYSELSFRWEIEDAIFLDSPTILSLSNRKSHRISSPFETLPRESDSARGSEAREILGSANRIGTEADSIQEAGLIGATLVRRTCTRNYKKERPHEKRKVSSAHAHSLASKRETISHCLSFAHTRRPLFTRETKFSWNFSTDLTRPATKESRAPARGRRRDRCFPLQLPVRSRDRGGDDPRRCRFLPGERVWRIAVRRTVISTKGSAVLLLFLVFLERILEREFWSYRGSESAVFFFFYKIIKDTDDLGVSARAPPRGRGPEADRLRVRVRHRGPPNDASSGF